MRLLEYNNDHENPLHLAAKTGILLFVVQGTADHLRSPANNRAEKSRDFTKKYEDYIRNTLRSKRALSKYGKTPFDYISKEVEEDIKKAIGAKDALMSNKKFCLFLCIAVTIVAATALGSSILLVYDF